MPPVQMTFPQSSGKPQAARSEGFNGWLVCVKTAGPQSRRLQIGRKFQLLRYTTKGAYRNVTMTGQLVLSAWRTNSSLQFYCGD
eukprot:3913912-Pyramimonas_sp.AAC.1